MMSSTDEHISGLQPGTVIAGKYEVIKCLGSGSMGSVYSCRHRELAGHVVAVKVLFSEVGQDEVAAARFRNEIFASYGVSHPNVVRAYEYIRDGDLIAYTMEHVEGGDLASRLQSAELMNLNDVVSILAQMCAGVQAIHAAGIVHRDLKPENILVTREGLVKIADFGIARTGQGPKLTEHGGVVGTIDYVSPEYMMKSQVDWRSDIYAMGILAYEMTTGQSPFQADSVYATMTLRIKTDPQQPSAIRLEAPKALDEIILKAMARDPEERYQSAAEMLYDIQQNLSEFLKSSEVRSPPRVVQLEVRYRGPTVNLSAKEAQGIISNDSNSKEAGGESAESGRIFNRTQSAAWSTKKTESIGTEIIDLSQQFQAEDEIYIPKMESVLSRRNAVINDLMGSSEQKSSYASSPSLVSNRGQRLLSDWSNESKRSLKSQLIKYVLFGIFFGIIAAAVLLKFI